MCRDSFLLVMLLLGLSAWGCVEEDAVDVDAGEADTETEIDTDTGEDPFEYLEEEAVAISASTTHTCALTAGGAAAYWGKNDYRQAGDGEGLVYPAATCEKLGDDVVAVSSGSVHTCVLTSSGGVRCAGTNESGELGTDEECPEDTFDCTFEDAVVPVGLESGVVLVAAGDARTCATLETGEAVCFGRNWHGETGQVGEEHDVTLVPSVVQGIAGPAVDFAMGWSHTCALIEGGAVQCWGYQDDGALGNSAIPDEIHPEPVDVVGLESGVVAIAAGKEASCALKETGDLYCWGRCNGDGDCGPNVSAGDAEEPVLAEGMPDGMIDVVMGEYYTCVLTDQSEVYCMGKGGPSLNDEVVALPENGIAEPHLVSGLPDDIVAVSGGASHACALASDGAVHCWGDAARGQLGSDPMGRAFVAPGMTAVEEMALSDYGVCGLLADGDVRCFSFPAHQGASGSLRALDGVTIACGWNHWCVIDSNGDLWCWGDNGYSQLGEVDTQYQTVPMVVEGVPGDLAGLSARENVSSVLTTDGRVFLVGAFERDTWVGEEHVIQAPLPPMEATVIGSGNQRVEDGNCAIGSDGKLDCLRRLTDTMETKLPYGVSSSTAELAQGDDHSCGVIGGVAFCAGKNNMGALGNGEVAEDVGYYYDEGPYDVVGIDGDVIDVAVGGSHSCALQEGGIVRCWGWNYLGQLGDGSMAQRLTATPVEGINCPVTEIAATAGFNDRTCALTEEGVVYCWGENVFFDYEDMLGSVRIVARPVRGFGGN